jgi:hypothetical protein
MLNRVADQHDWPRIEQLPGYASKLNPIEQVWGNVKSAELANLCCDSVGEVQAIAGDGLAGIGTDGALCIAFLRHCGLRL